MPRCGIWTSRRNKSSFLVEFSELLLYQAGVLDYNHCQWSAPKPWSRDSSPSLEWSVHLRVLRFLRFKGLASLQWCVGFQIWKQLVLRSQKCTMEFEEPYGREFCTLWFLNSEQETPDINLFSFNIMKRKPIFSAKGLQCRKNRVRDVVGPTPVPIFP